MALDRTRPRPVRKGCRGEKSRGILKRFQSEPPHPGPDYRGITSVLPGWMTPLFKLFAFFNAATEVS